LVRSHDVQVKIWLDLEVLERLIQHCAMLTRVHNGRLEFSRSAPQLVNHERELDGLWSRAQDCDDPARVWQLRSLQGRACSKGRRLANHHRLPRKNHPPNSLNRTRPIYQPFSKALGPKECFIN
jgi:hypothetical protein